MPQPITAILAGLVGSVTEVDDDDAAGGVNEWESGFFVEGLEAVRGGFLDRRGRVRRLGHGFASVVCEAGVPVVC